MCATDLPDELLLEIVAVVSQCDVIQFSQTCRKFQMVAKQKVQQYRKMEEEYSWCTLDKSKALQILLELCSNPDMAHFPKSLDCSAMCRSRTDPNDYLMAHGMINSTIIQEDKRKEHCGNIRAALSSIGYLKSPWLPIWTEHFMHKYETSYRPVMPLLLACFRNLRTISVPCFCAIDNPLLFELIDAATNESDPEAGAGALSRLSTVILAPYGGCQTTGMIYLIKFLALPLLRHVKAVGVTWEPPDSIRLNPRSSGVTSISLLNSRVSAQTVSRFLENTYALESFTYEARIWEDDHFYPVLKTLISYVPETLSHLTMYSRTGKEMSFYALDLMKKLKKLHTLGLAQRWVIDTSIQRYFWNSIPTTVETLALYADVDTFGDGKALVGEMDRVQEVAKKAASWDFTLSKVTLDAFSGQAKPEEWQPETCTR